MNPYLTIPVCLPGNPDNPKSTDKTVDGKILPGQVIAYHPGHFWGTFIYMQAATFLTPLTVEEYEEKVRAYWLHVNQNQNKKKHLLQ